MKDNVILISSKLFLFQIWECVSAEWGVSANSAVKLKKNHDKEKIVFFLFFLFIVPI